MGDSGADYFAQSAINHWKPKPSLQAGVTITLA